jgi:hypothetical protein
MDTNSFNPNQYKMEVIKDLGMILENILKGLETEHEEIYFNYLTKIHKLAKIFTVNIEKEIEIKREKDDNTDDEELIKKYANDMGDIDSVSEYADSDIDSQQSTNVDDFIDDLNYDDNELNNVKQSLKLYDITMKKIYDTLLNSDVVVIKKI